MIAAGVESMTRIPMGSDAGMGVPGVAPAVPFSPLFNEKFTFVPQHTSAEMIAEKWGISRARLRGVLAREPPARGAAREQGRFKDEIVAAQGEERRRRRAHASRPTRASAPTRRWRSWRR